MPALVAMLAASVNAGTVLALAGLGLLVNERAGVVNLGAEGMMLVGALAGYATAMAVGRAGWRAAGVRAGGGDRGVARGAVRPARHLASARTSTRPGWR